MKETRRVALLIIIMAVVSLFIGTIFSAILYEAAVEEQRERLFEIITSREIHLREMIEKEIITEKKRPDDTDDIELVKILEAHIHFFSLEETGEIVIAKREGNLMRFLVRKKEHASRSPEYLSFNSSLAEPMRRALSGLSGTTIALDYRGKKVLAAYCPIGDLDLGIVAKIDIDEVRAPFIHAGLISSIFGLLFVVIGALLFTRVTHPMIRHIEESEKRYRMLIHRMNDAFAVLDENGRFTLVNDKFVEMFGYPEDEAIGKKATEFFDKKNQQILKDQLATRKKGKEDSYEIEWTRKDGKKVVTIISPTPIFDSKGRYKGTYAPITDISNIKKYEERLKALNKDLTIRERELLRSNRDLEQFAYVASHDLQEPLRAVSSFSQLLSQRYGDKLDADAKEFIGFIVNGSLRMQQLINDLLAFSRVSTRGKPFETTDSNSILGQAMANLSTMIEENRAIITNGELPTVNIDGSQLVQVFQNLIGNAIKFRGKDLPAVYISAHEKDGDWVFAVRDNGIGIELQYFDKIFVIFQRLHGKEEYPGTGIGLSICKKIIERHGGSIWVESEPEKGSTFYFTIPK